MANYYSIKIPEPCHEGWETMSPKDKGRFCGSCNKTVVDFTKMNSYQIQDFLNENKDQRICGHIKQTQLDSINLRIPLQLIQQNHSVYKSFFLAAMIVMGTTLFSCSSKNGNTQKIDSIEIIDSTKNEVIDVLGMIPHAEKIDSVINKNVECKTQKNIHPSNRVSIINTITDGEMIITHNRSTKRSPIVIDTLEVVKPEDITIEGDMLLGFIVPTSEPYPLSIVEELPKFKGTPKFSDNSDELKYFHSSLSDFFKTNFNTAIAKDLGLKGKQRVFVSFEISNTGAIKILQTKAPHLPIEKEAERVLKKLPQFIPAVEDGKAVSVNSTLPIIINAED